MSDTVEEEQLPQEQPQTDYDPDPFWDEHIWGEPPAED